VFALCRYNHIAYKVDDVDWTRTPASTFPTRKKDADGKFLKGKDGEFIKEEISFAQYFKQVRMSDSGYFFSVFHGGVFSECF
jgi:PAZ domain